jgi:nitrate reductase NapAB chaperone NapD
MDESGDQADEQQAGEKPIGVEEQKTIERQEAEAKEERSTEDVNELTAITTEEIIGKAQEQGKNEANAKQNDKDKSKPLLKDQSTKLFDQFTKHFQISKVVNSNTTNMLKQIQKQLNQIDKTTANSNKQQIVIKQLVVQVKAMQKQLDKIGGSVNRIKNIPTNKRKAPSHKRNKK